jgi:hypothetical protein
MAIWKKQEQPPEQQPAARPARRRRQLISWSRPSGSRCYPSPADEARARFGEMAKEHTRRQG